MSRRFPSTSETLDSVLNVQTTTVAGQQSYRAMDFPLVVQPATDVALQDVLDWLAKESQDLVSRARSHGALLFRDFPLRTAEDFDSFIAAFQLENFPYAESLSNAVRLNRTERVFTANESPPDVKIYLHHEMAQTPVYPSHLFFFCEQPAASGGATPICRSDELWQRLELTEPVFADDCRRKGLLYSHIMPAADDPKSGMGRSWQQTLRADSRDAAQRRMAQLGYSWDWQENGSLRATTPVLPAIREVETGRFTFFNQLIAAYEGWSAAGVAADKSITFGDGARLPAEAVQSAVKIAAELTFDIPWQQGDVALLDNFVCMHGRRTFSGERRILASLIRDAGS